ncbi:uncharacterized protein LOC132260707 [Phlebotomus argentipes]|uniref:uncharacterized protein LOC132260707 n=1 Tax=Phlebotomus argentipes TaxID=94469 RepID=UPI0028932F16|nr:uncharacterized protein LOC132260707 [Phlebotomus argentipes]
MAGKKQEFKASSSEDMELTMILSIVALIGVGICVSYLSYGENIYSVGVFWPSPVIITLICNELGKYLIYAALFKEEKTTLNPRETVAPRKRKPMRLRIGDALKFTALIAFFVGLYAIMCIALGAPALENHEETLVLASVLTILTVLPLALFLGTSGCIQYVWTESVEGMSKVEASYVTLVKISAAGALFGAWSGSIVAPLDWDRRWQAYPIPNIVGALLGYTLGDLGVLGHKLISSIVPSFSFIP